MNTPMKFLVVDDERDVEMLFRQKFRKEVRRGEIDLQFAFSGKEALEVLSDQASPEVMYIFSDINMPGMSGLELLDEVKQKFPSIHVSMISAYGNSDYHQKAMDSGAKEFFTKPIDFASLKDELDRVIEKKS
jgi:YesN/AraC family two-component response regulator